MSIPTSLSNHPPISLSSPAINHFIPQKYKLSYRSLSTMRSTLVLFVAFISMTTAIPRPLLPLAERAAGHDSSLLARRKDPSASTADTTGADLWNNPPSNNEIALASPDTQNLQETQTQPTDFSTPFSLPSTNEVAFASPKNLPNPRVQSTDSTAAGLTDAPPAPSVTIPDVSQASSDAKSL